jgi:hypothetical protein
MDLPGAMSARVPDMLRGACVMPLPPGALVPLTAFVAALFCGVVMRSAYDLGQPIPVGDERESGRHFLQWCMVMSFTVLLYLALKNMAGIAGVPAPDAFGPWLRAALFAYGGALAVRSLVRMQITMFRRDAVLTPSIPEVDRREPVEEVDALPPLPALERAEPEHRFVGGRNWPGFLIGALLVAVAAEGWDMQSLCLLRLAK